MGTIAKIKTTSATHLIASTALAVCDTAADVADKDATIQDSQDFTLIKGTTVHVKFENTNTAIEPSLSVNSTGRKSIYRYGTTPPGVTELTSWRAGAIISFTYDGTAWMMNDSANDDDNTHYISGTVVTDSASSTSNTNVPLQNGSVFINHVENGEVKNSHQLTGSSGMFVTTDATGNINISGQLASVDGPGYAPALPAVSTGEHFLREDGIWAIPAGTATGTINELLPGTGLSGGGSSGTVTLNHSNSVTPLTTESLCSIAIDAQGHISSYTVGASIYPVGAIYLSTVNVDPGTLFPGTTWRQLKDRFLLGAGDSYTAGNTGGSVTHGHTFNGSRVATEATAIAETQMPSHYHSVSYNRSDGAGGGSWLYLDNNTPYNNARNTDSKGGSLGHSHYVTTSGSVANGGSLPPYLVVYMWERTA